MTVAGHWIFDESFRDQKAMARTRPRIIRLNSELHHDGGRFPNWSAIVDVPALSKSTTCFVGDSIVKNTRLFGVIVLWLGTFLAFQSSAEESPTAAQTPGTQQEPHAADLAAIRGESEAFVAAFNKGDAKAVAALWTDDGEYIDDTGRHFTGREAIEKGYADYFANNRNTKVKIAIDSLRMLSADAAIEDGRAVTDPPADDAGGFSRYTATHVKVDGKWLMASVRDTWVEPPAATPVRGGSPMARRVVGCRRARREGRVGLQLGGGQAIH